MATDGNIFGKDPMFSHPGQQDRNPTSANKPQTIQSKPEDQMYRREGVQMQYPYQVHTQNNPDFSSTFTVRLRKEMVDELTKRLTARTSRGDSYGVEMVVEEIGKLLSEAAS